MFLTKKWGILIKKESGSLIFTGLKIPRDYYYAKGAHYETATLSSIALLPEEGIHKALAEDYQAMRNMIYGDVPDFEDILAFLEKLEAEIHGL